MTQEDLKIVKLSNGEQVVCYFSYEEGSEFVRLIEPLELKLHSNINEHGAVDETICLTDWIHHTADKTFSIAKNRIMTITKPDQGLIDYYASSKKKYDKQKNLIEKQRVADKNARLLEDKFTKGDVKLTKKELYDILAGKITKH